MTLSLIFWILMLLWLVFGIYTHRASPWPGGVADLLVFLLFLVVGWGTFGAPVK